MKEVYLTVTSMTFLAGDKVLGHGLTVSAAPGPENPAQYPDALAAGALRMGTFRPAAGQPPPGRHPARLEGEDGYLLTFRGNRFLLGRDVPQSLPRAARQ